MRQIYPNRTNPNWMDPEDYMLLKKAVAKDEYDAIIVSPMKTYYTEDLLASLHYEADADHSYVICDGEFRYRAAVELGKSDIDVEIWNMTEAQAIPYFYQRQKIRGKMDPVKEAALFQHERVVNGKSRAEIVRDLNLSGENYIKTRMKLLNVSDAVIKLFYKPPGHLPGRLTFTHLRDLSVVRKRQQKDLAMLVLEKNWTTRDLADEIRRVKEEAGTRQDQAYVPAPTHQPPARPSTRVYTRPKMEERSALREQPIEKEELEVDLEAEIEVDRGPMILSVKNIAPLLRIVLDKAEKEGLDLATFDPIDDDLVKKLKKANEQFFEDGVQTSLPEIVMRAMQLYVRSEINWDEIDEP